MNSRGSIIPLILKIKSENKKIVPLTDERMTRFLISLNFKELLDLLIVLNNGQGEIFIPKMLSVYIKI